MAITTGAERADEDPVRALDDLALAQRIDELAGDPDECAPALRAAYLHEAARRLRWSVRPDVDVTLDDVPLPPPPRHSRHDRRRSPAQVKVPGD